MNLNEINTKNWQLSNTFAGVVLDIDDIRQCIGITLMTRKGSDPFRPLFGCDVFEYLDKPIPEAMPLMKNAILEAITTYEPRVTITRIIAIPHGDEPNENAGIRFNIYFTTPDNGNELLYVFSPNGGTVVQPGNLTLQAQYPDGAIRYFFSLTIDGHAYAVPAGGFQTVQLLWSWIQNNLINLGNWYFLPTLNKFVLYVKAITGSMSITPLVGVQALFPDLQDGQYFVVIFNGSASPEETLYTVGDVMGYVNATWGGSGTWSTDGEYLIYVPNEPGENTLTILAASVGAFSSGFSSGFTI